jgi:formamidopyrimidine-DNA glycosylase
MPELPEVETVVRGLSLSLPGRAIIEVRLGKTDFIDDPIALAEQLPGARVVNVARRAKFIFIEMISEGANAPPDPKFFLVIHLGMTGRLTICHPADPVLPHTHVFFSLDDGRELRFTDSRRFGRMLVVAQSKVPEIFGPMGAEPLDITLEEFCVRFGARGGRIKGLLLDQSILGGVGNIYADESLFRARIHPARIAGNLTQVQLTALHRSVREILNAAIQFRGSSVSDYADSEGNRGKFQQRHRVYKRTGKPCVRCREPIRRIIVAGRSSHFCPKCQPAPRTRKVRRRRGKS